MTTPRQAMDAALKRAVADHLRPRGFTGVLPHLRRRSETRIDLVSFQYYSAGGKFVVEVAACDPTGFTTPWGAHIAPEKVRAQDVASQRPRLGSASFPIGDHWFVFGQPNYERGSDRIYAPAHYDEVASEVIRLIAEQAEPFWRTNPFGK